MNANDVWDRDGGGLRLMAYRVADGDVEVERASPSREWMVEQPLKLAHHCLPLRMANQVGWVIKNPAKVIAEWDGGNWTNSLRISSELRCVISNFGSGIVTWTFPYLFRTPTNWQLWVKGPANDAVDGATALEGIVETDHATMTFTMNWRLTRPGRVVWEQGAPICQLIPVRLAALEGWSAEVIRKVPNEIQEAYDSWSTRRFENNLIRPNVRDGTYRDEATMRGLTATFVPERRGGTGAPPKERR